MRLSKLIKKNLYDLWRQVKNIPYYNTFVLIILLFEIFYILVLKEFMSSCGGEDILKRKVFIKI